MKHTRFYPTAWQQIPYAFGNATSMENGEEIFEVVLKNEMVQELEVSEMVLNLSKITAIADSGEEYKVLDFSGQNGVQLKSMYSGLFLQTKQMMQLPLGTYTGLRFYLNGNGNTFSYSDGMVEQANEFEYLEFNLEKALKISSNQGVVKLWFDLKPYKFGIKWNAFIDTFKVGKKQRPRLVGSFGN